MEEWRRESRLAQVKSAGCTFRYEAGSAGIKKTGDLGKLLDFLSFPSSFFPSGDDLPIQL